MFAYINKFANLRVHKRTGGRKLHGGRNDAVTDLLAECETPEKIADMAYKFGMTRPDIKSKAVNAHSFGHFRMMIGHKIRGICTRLEKSSKRGEKLSLKTAAYNS